jgi:hypothetical protein
MKTTATLRRSGYGSSESAALQLSLESKLMQRLELGGSTLFSQSLKRITTPAGRSLSMLRASGHRTSGSDFTSWPTPNAGPQNDTDSNWQNRREELKAKHRNGNGFGMTLGMASTLASWPTPMAGTPARKGYNEAGNTDSSRRTVALLTALATPRAEDSECAGAHRGKADGLHSQAQLTDSGDLPTGSPASTAKRGQLRAGHSRWLMSIPNAWDACAPTETRSVLNKRRSS